MLTYVSKQRVWRELRLYAEMLVEPIRYLGFTSVLFEAIVALLWLFAINLCVALDSNVEAPFWGWEALVCLLFAHMTIAAVFYEAVRQEAGTP